MRLRLYFTIILILSAIQYSSAQSYIIKGKVQDTLNSTFLERASVTLIHASDSIMETFTRTKADGSFELHPQTSGKYLIMVTFPGFVDYVDVIKLEKKSIDLGNLPLITRSHMLTEFVFQQNRGAIKVKGDTIEYVADSFKVKDNAAVEDLLKKLPGLQVDKNGQVTAQGEKVQKILVDGEEFFSDDPAVVTKNLAANTVDKVQVFDKKSDQAEFTGIDDGIKEKTINLQLKEDKKKGYFGKLVAGGGANDKGKGFFENQGMINDFKGKRQLSAFGIASNTGKIGLGWDDKSKFNGGGTSILADNISGGDMDNMMFSSGTPNDDFESWNGTYNGEGLPRVYTGGLHYANKWRESKDHLSANYRYSNQDIETQGTTTTDYVLPQGNQTTTETRKISSIGNRHSADALFETKLDSMSDLKITAAAGYYETKKSAKYTSSAVYSNIDSIYHDGDLANTGNRTINSNASTKKENVDIVWRRKFKKKGRTLSISLAESYKEDVSDGFLASSNTFFLPSSTPGSTTIIDQEKKNNNSILSGAGKVDYTEPLSKIAFLELNYTARIDNSSSKRTSLNKDSLGEYAKMDSTLSSNYEFNVFTNVGGANVRFVLKKMNISAGGAISNANYQQHDLQNQKDTSYNYLNFFPRVNFNYKFSQTSNLYVSYNGATKQPTITQIQPLRDNTDPLNIAQGNPNLKQEFRQTVSARYNDYKILSGRYIWFNASLTGISNAITRVDNITPLGRTYHYENVQGNYFAWGYLGYGLKIPKTDIQAGLFGNTTLTHTITSVNGQKNVSNTNGYGGGMRVNYDKDKISLSFTPQVTYNDNRSTISTYTTSYWSGQIELESSFQLPLKFEIGTDVDWSIRQRTVVFTGNNNVFRWNAYVSKKFLPKSQLELRLSAFDILNQNIGFNRYASGNTIYQDNYNTVSRYGLVSLIWNFSKTPLGSPDDGGGGMRFRR